MNTKIVLLIIVVLHTTTAGTKDALRKIKNKAKGFYNSKYGKDKSWHFLGQDLTEYPGSNEKYLEINKEKWDTYYKCLDAQNKNLGNQLSITPEAIAAFEGGNIKFECRICISPQEQEKTDTVTWNWAADIDAHLTPIQFTENIFESPEDKTLHIYNLQMENTGQYMCNLGESLTAPYFLTILTLSDKEIVEVHPHDTFLEPQAKEAEILDHNLVLDTQWEDWSTCSKCDAIGKKHKLGYCIIYLKDNVTKTIPNIKLTNKSEEMIIEATDLELFDIFTYGIPCNSHILPKSIKKQSQIKNRKNEIMTGYCNVKCPKNKVFTVKDRNGKVIEVANNSAGIYSLLQSLPSPEATIERKLQYGVKGKTVILSCPGNMNSDSPVQWQIGNKNLIPEIISKESNGRIFISVTDKIHINDARLFDSNIYSCWQQKELVGTVRLIVEKKFQMNFNHHVMLLGVIVILSTFVYVFIKAFLGKKYAKIKK